MATLHAVLGEAYLTTYNQCIFLVFLLLTLLIGIRAGSGIKDLREYTLANKRYGTGALVLTYLATDIGGGTLFGDTKEVFANGIIMTAALSGFLVSFLFRAFFIAPKMGYFRECLTLGDVMGKLYGTTGKVISGILSLLFAITVAGLQLKTWGIICEQFLGLNACWSICWGGLLLTAYAAWGGIKAVTATDIFQFLILIIVIPLIAALAVEQAGGMSTMLSQVPVDKFDVFGHENFAYYFTFFLMWGVCSTEMMDPAIMQRILMASNARQLRQLFFVVGASDFAFRLAIMLIGLAALVCYPTIDAAHVMPHMVQELLPASLQGIAVVGFLAVVMSTADSFLHAAGLTFIHDVAVPLYSKATIKIDALKWAKYSTFLLGFAAIIIGLQAGNLLQLSLIALQFMAPMLTFPLLAGILGLKPEKSAFYAAIVAALLALALSHLGLPVEQVHLGAIISTIASGGVFLGTHMIKNGGLVMVKRTARAHKGIEENFWQPKTRKVLANWKQYAPTPHNLVRYSQQRVAKYSAPYVLFGVFCCINFTLPYFMWPQSLGQAPHLMLYLRLIGATLCALLIVREKWPAYLRPYMPAFWHFTLLYCIPFTSTLMFLLTHGSIEWLINVAITIMFLVVLVDWVSFLLLTALGISLGFLFYSLAIGPIDLQLDFTSGYLLVYQGIFATLIGLIFARRKQQRAAKQQKAFKAAGQAHQTTLLQAAEERVKALKTLQSTGVQGLLQVAKDLQELHVEKGDVSKLHTLEATLIPLAFQLQGIDTRAQDYLRLQVAAVPIKQWLSTVQENLLEKGIDLPIRCQQTTQHKELVCDPERLATLLIKSIAALQEQATGQEDEQRPLLLGLEDTWLHYPLPDVAKGYIKKVKALRMVVTTADSLPALAPCYWPDLTTAAPTAPATPQTLEQLANERIIKAHYGYAEVAPNTLRYVIPVDVKEVRPKDMDKRHMELGEAPVRANDHYKSAQVDAQAQEKEFLAAVEARSRADIGLVKTALELIKWYHGPMNRHSGEPFYLHPLTVAQIVLDYNTDEPTILGALLHDTVEDTWMCLQHIETVFGKKTAEVVDVVTHLQSLPGSIYKVKLSSEENLRMLEKAGNKRGLYVKLADRMHNIRTIKGYDDIAKQQLIAKETMRFFVPLAEKLGLPAAAEELKERCFAVLRSAE